MTALPHRDAGVSDFGSPADPHASTAESARGVAHDDVLPRAAAALRIAVLVSGGGTNLRAMASAIDTGKCAASITLVVADREHTAALQFAAERGYPTRVVAGRAFDVRADWDEALTACLREAAPDVVVLAGFMRLVGPALLAAFAGKIINVHPSLLPAFPGVDAPAQALAKGVWLTGCTVHVVDAGVDTGPILAQAVVPVLPEDDAASLHARIQRAEHALLPRVVNAIADRVLVLDTRPRWQRLPAPCAPLAWPLALD